jgi:hypothetical protein
VIDKYQSLYSAIRLIIIHIEIENLTTLDINGTAATAFVGLLKEEPNE